MDMMEMRFRMMAMMGGEKELWNKATIIVPTNMTTCGDVYNWLTTAGVLPNFNSFFFAVRDNADITTWNSDDFIEASWLKEQNEANIIFVRIRSPQQSNRYFQTRNPINSPTDVSNVYQGETFTVFYQ